MQFRIPQGQIESRFYDDFCRYLFKRVNRSVEELASQKKYRVREKVVCSSTLLQWTVPEIPSEIGLYHYVINCLSLVYEKGEYIIQVNPRTLVRGTTTPVRTLVRLLEYGNEKLPPYPMITRVLEFYQENYSYFVKDYLRRKVVRRSERLFVRRGPRQETKRGRRR